MISIINLINQLKSNKNCVVTFKTSIYQAKLALQLTTVKYSKKFYYWGGRQKLDIYMLMVYMSQN